MPVIFTPLRLDRVQRALFEVFEEATGLDVGWSYSEVPQEALTSGFVSLTMVVGPAPNNRMHKRGTTIQPIDTVALTIGPLVADKRIGVILNDFNYFEDVTGIDTVTTVRDRFIAQINDADNTEPVTASSSGPDGLVLTADFLGAIAVLSIYGAVTAGTPTLNAGHVYVVEGTQTMLVNVQAYSKGREPRTGSNAIIQQCTAALQTEDLVEKFRRFGVGIWPYAGPTDLSAIAGAHWETRSSFDVTVAARARWARPVDVIETVTGTVNTAIFSEPFSATAP